MSMDASRISALLEPFLGPPGDRRLSTNDLDRISTYIDLLLRWNARINLTAIRDPEQIVPRHFGESLFLARHLFPGASVQTEGARFIAPLTMSGDLTRREEGSKLEAQSSKLLHVVDLGSGAGFPALPIKIWAPCIHLTMIESNHKKATFLREAARALTLTNVDVIAERAEAVAARLQQQDQTPPPTTGPAAATFPLADVVTFRAVEKFSQILPLAAAFLSPSATLAILIAESQLEQLRTISSMTWQTIHIPQSHQGTLALGKPVEQERGSTIRN